MFYEVLFSVLGLACLLICGFLDKSDVADVTVDIHNYMIKSMQATQFPYNSKKIRY